ncbi:MAG: lysozyme inhibitor LprI family protein [Acinetobacter sp.]|uniref:lysozyme inhibitor LprI family protein n=1 Tax=Acinetobacter TaxID=469 RepID=UPI001880C2CE|nr:lysozyme inhibitor LprI family protein [Acinetobacter albensis]MBE9401896.1 DUF1311 domain-containing protein [Acinetobacter albensis]
MHFLSAIILTAGSLSAVAVWAQSGDSQEYNQCLNTSYGQSEIIITCIDKELKIQEKLLKKYYKSNLENNASHQKNLEQQHQLWLNRMKQQCHFGVTSSFIEIKQKKCLLEMTKERVYYYEMKQIGYK